MAFGLEALGADVAQLVEQLIRNEQVTGSIPAIGSIRLCDLECRIVDEIPHFIGVFLFFALQCHFQLMTFSNIKVCPRPEKRSLLITFFGRTFFSFSSLPNMIVYWFYIPHFPRFTLGVLSSRTESGRIFSEEVFLNRYDPSRHLTEIPVGR